jgi:hypothetical protein
VDHILKACDRSLHRFHHQKTALKDITKRAIGWAMNEEELNSSSPSDSSLTNTSSLSSPTFGRSKLPSEQLWTTANFSQGLTPPPDFTEPRDNSQQFQQLGGFEGDFERSTIFSLGYQQPLTPSSISVISDSSDLDSRSKKGRHWNLSQRRLF